MYTGKIIDLDSISYIVLEETNYAGRIIVLLAPINTETDQIDQENLAIKELVENNGELEVKTIESPTEVDVLSKLLLNKISAK